MNKNLLESIDSLDRLTNNIVEDSHEESSSNVDNILSMCYKEYANSNYTPSKEDLEEYADLTDEEYKRVISKLEEFNNLPRYETQHNSFLQLSDNHTLNMLGDRIDKKIGQLSEKDFELAVNIYNTKVETALDSFQENSNTAVYCEGRMGRHICVEDTYANACRFAELQQLQKEMEDTLLDEVVSELANKLDISKTDESEDLTEDLSIDETKKLQDELFNWEDTLKQMKRTNKQSIERDGKTYFIFDIMDHIDDLKKQLDEDFTATQASNPEEIQGFEGIDETQTQDADLQEQVLADGTESELNTLIEDLKALQNEIKHSIENSIISLNARISKINEDNGLLIDEIEIDNIYSNIGSVISDIEYELKDSEWSKEEALETSEESEAE